MNLFRRKKPSGLTASAAAATAAVMASTDDGGGEFDDEESKCAAVGDESGVWHVKEMRVMHALRQSDYKSIPQRICDALRRELNVTRMTLAFPAHMGAERMEVKYESADVNPLAAGTELHTAEFARTFENLRRCCRQRTRPGVLALDEGHDALKDPGHSLRSTKASVQTIVFTSIGEWILMAADVNGRRWTAREVEFFSRVGQELGKAIDDIVFDTIDRDDDAVTASKKAAV